MSLELKISEFLRDAQFKVAELTNELRGIKKRQVYAQKSHLRKELIFIIGLLWESNQEITDGSRFLGEWKDGEIEAEIDYYRGLAQLNQVPYISFTGYNPIIIETNSTGGNLPDGVNGQYIRYNASNVAQAVSLDRFGGTTSSETLEQYFSSTGIRSNPTQYFRHPVGLEEDWELLNPTLQKGVVGFVQDQSGTIVNYKVGPGAWNDLNYIVTTTGVYQSDIPDSVSVTSDVGGVQEGELAGTLKGLTFSGIFDRVFFPNKLAEFSSVSLSLSSDLNQTEYEIGAAIQPQLTAVFSPGTITNGDGSQGPNLVGIPSDYVYSGGSIIGIVTIVTSDYSDQYTPASSVVQLGENKFSCTVNYTPGTGEYFDNYGNAINNLDSQRQAGFITADSPSFFGRRKAFFGTGSLVTDSSEVRALAGFILLDSDENGEFTISIPSGETQISFSVPANKNVSVKFRESSNAEVMESFQVNTFSVADASGSLHPYDNYTSELASGGYPTDSNYDITIS